VGVKSILDAAVFHEDVQFSDTDLDGAIREQASLFARYTSRGKH
jgi:hypothetical protein